MDYLNTPIENLKPEESRVRPWFAIDGDNTLRVDYELNKNSVVIDVGGYLGDWAIDIAKRYGSKIEVFEPVHKFTKKIETRARRVKNITVHPYGLSGKNEEIEINLEDASSSTFKSGRETEKIKLVAASDVLKKMKKVDLMKINIEGGEYSLLDNLIRSGDIKKIKNIQVQFHIFVPGAAKKRGLLQNKLSRTHFLTYSYPWIWENWRLKDG